MGTVAIERRCRNCGALIASTSRPDRKFCSASCRQAAYEQRLRENGRERPTLVQLPEASALEQLLDVEKLVGVLVKHAYANEPTSWRAALILLQTLYPERWASAKP
jgi:hypothetical protein